MSPYRFDADAPLGADLVSDGSGVDTLDFAFTATLGVVVDLDSLAAQIVNANLTLTLASGAALSNLVGGDQADVLRGNALANVLTGGLGDDTLAGGAGNDTLIGGAGDDTHQFDLDSALGADVVDESAGGVDALDFSASSAQVATIDLSLSLAQVVHSNLTLTLGSASTLEKAIGGALADTLRGNALANILLGGPGDDHIYGGAGRDVVLGGDGADALAGEADDDLLVHGPTAHDALPAALLAIFNEWTSASAYLDRVANIRAGVGGAALIVDDTVWDDGMLDALSGGSEQDWFLADPADSAPDRDPGETLDQGEIGFAKAYGLIGDVPDDNDAVAVDAAGNTHVATNHDAIGDPGSNPGDGDFSIASYDPQGGLRWRQTYVSAGVDNRARDIVIAADGSLYVVGAFEGTLDFDPSSVQPGDTQTATGGLDGFLLKLNASEPSIRFDAKTLRRGEGERRRGGILRRESRVDHPYRCGHISHFLLT